MENSIINKISSIIISEKLKTEDKISLLDYIELMDYINNQISNKIKAFIKKTNSKLSNSLAFFDYEIKNLEIDKDIIISINHELTSKKIGEGFDAVVYSAINGNAFKIYKEDDIQIDDDIQTKKYNQGDYKSFPNKRYRFRYIDKDDIVIYYKDAADKIIDRQKVINKTKLPVASLYVDNRFVGYVIKKINGVQLHYAWIILGRKTKIKILKELLSKVKELTDNYVYPTDMANSPFVGKHSNVLVNFKLKPEIIDLEGTSTSYREKEDSKLLEDTLFSLNLLYLELLLGPDYFEDLDEVNNELIERLLIDSNIDKDTAHRLSKLEGSYDDLNELILTVSKKK